MTKENEEGWPKEKRSRPKMAKYGGMSVKEIYDALDHRERLIEAYKEKQDECQKLRDGLRKSVDRIIETGRMYMDLAGLTKDPVIKLEFLSKSSGMQEALRYVREIIFNDDSTDEENNSERVELA